MNKEWFELNDYRKRDLSKAVWIPLRAIQPIISEGKHGHAGFKKEFYGASSLAIPNAQKGAAAELDWNNFGISHGHGAYVEDGRYHPCDIYEEYQGKFTGLHLVLEQRTSSEEPTIWHLHHDLVIALKLFREGDIWLCPEEGYVDVVHLRRDSNGKPVLLEIRAEFLKDYLCARDMSLRITSYRERACVLEDASHVDWPDETATEEHQDLKWNGHKNEIHEGGMPYGESAAVFHVARTDVDPDEDVPTMDLPNDGALESTSWTVPSSGQKLFLVQGRLWRNYWIDKGDMSPRIRGDKPPATVFFVTDAAGTRESRETLDRQGRWLWFKPDVVMALAHRRGGSLEWYTRETGEVGCAPDSTVHFGVNKLGLINVYAKDISLLADWEQAIWAAHNVGPDGGVSEELQASQVRAVPASTQAPEAFLGPSIEKLDETLHAKYGFRLLRKHDDHEHILAKVHRFRGLDEAGLFALAKDIARLTADSFETAGLHSLATPPKGEKWGSLKSIEKALATLIDPANARSMLSPLVATYELRLADAHLPSSEVEEAFALLKIDRALPRVHQARQMLHACVSSLVQIRKTFAVGKAD